MKTKKIFITIFVFIYLIFTFNLVVLADDVDLENLSNKEIEDSLETSSEVENIPNINSRAAVVIDRNTNMVLYGKNENEKKKMASTTKIMTAIIVLENGNLNDLVIVSKKAASTGGSRLGLKTGDKITVQDLLYGLMLCSGNDDAVT